MNHFWSLAVEEQVYLIYPLFFLLLKKRKNIFLGLVILLVVIVIARIITFYYNTGADNYKSIYCNTFFRSDSFLLGSLLYFFLNFYQSPVAIKIFEITSYLIVLLFFYSFWFSENFSISNPFYRTIGYTLIAIVYAYLIWLTVVKENHALNSIVSLKMLQHIGKISYGIYVLHWPIFVLGISVIYKISNSLHLNLTEGTVHIIDVSGSTILTLLLSNLSFTYFESYFLKLKFKM